jgi:tetratricopeptide (TPR) repeat protein
MPESNPTSWTPRVRRISTPDVAEQGKLAFIRSLIWEERYDEAEVELQQLLAENARSYRVNVMMGRLFERKGDHARAAEHFETARAADPTRAEAALLAGKAYLSLRDLPRAGEALQVALDLNPRAASAHYGLAQVHFSADDLQAAESHLRKAIDFDPQLKPARALLARVHNRLGDYDSSKQELEEILATRPDRRRATLALARIHLREQRPNEALALLQTALRHHEDDVELLTVIGRAKLAIEDYAGAEESLRRALAGAPRTLPVALHLVATLTAQGKAQEATAILDRLPEAARQLGFVQKAYAKVYAATEHYKQAAEAYRAVLLRSGKGEALVAEIEKEISQQGYFDWKWLTERFEESLDQVRASVREDLGERVPPRRARGKRLRQLARPHKARA